MSVFILLPPRCREQLSTQLMEQRQRVLHPPATTVPSTVGAPDMASQPLLAGQTYKSPVSMYTEEPVTAALGAGRIAELKAQLNKAKVR